MLHVVQYEIYLTKELDYFNDILPICIEIRKMLKYSEVVVNLYESKYKIVVFSYEKLANRFNKCSTHSLKYQTILNNLWKTNYPITYEDKLYSDVKLYKNKIKHNSQNQIAIHPDEYINLTNTYNELNKIINTYDKYLNYTEKEIEKLESEKQKIFDILEIQNLIQETNAKYYNKIKAIESELTNIELSEEENAMLQRVLNHPTLNNIIEYHGFNLVEIKN